MIIKQHHTEKNKKKEKIINLLKYVFTFVLIISGMSIWLFKFVLQSQAAWFDDSWHYRKSIEISAHTSAETNVYLDLTGSNAIDTSTSTGIGNNIQSDCGDFRFTKQDGKPLPYYLTTSCNLSGTTGVHVLFDNFPAGAQTIYLYYGNPSAANGFSGSDFSKAASAVTIGSTGSQEKAQGPIAYWRFDEGYGTSVNDSTTNAYMGVLSGSTVPYWQTEDLCISGKCLYFNGSTASVTVSNTINNVQTVSFWAKPETTTQYFIDLDGGTHYIWVNSGTVTATGFTSPTIYVNGVQSSTLVAYNWQLVTITTSTGFNASSIKIGNVSTHYFNGFMDEVKLYDYSRSSDQVKLDYVAGLNRQELPKGAGTVLGGVNPDIVAPLSSGLVGYWKMDEVSGNAADSSGNGITLTNTNTVAYAAGKFGNSGSFTAASSQYFTTSTAISGVQTIAFWINPTSISSNTNIIDFDGGTHTITFSSGTVTANGFTGTTTVYVNGAAGSTIAAGVWQHVVVTTTGSFNTTTMTPGKIGTGYYGGNLDDLRIYNRALTPAEVQQLYNWAPEPVGWWRFEDGSGTSIADSSGYGATGTIYGAGYSWTAGKFGKALDLSNSTCADAGNPNQLQVTGDLTLSTWVNTDALAGTQNMINKRSGSAKNAYDIKINSNGKVQFDISPDGTTTNIVSVSSNTVLSPNVWYYLTGVYTHSSIMAIYVNGVLDNSKTTSIPGAIFNPVIDLNLGGATCISKPVNTLNGTIDDARVYNYARSQSQIAEDMNGGHPLGGNPAGSAVGYWKFDEGYGITAYDSSINNDSGTLTNMSSPATAISGWEQSGKFGRALRFDGSNDFVTLTIDVAPLKITADLSISAWINLGTNNAVHDIVAKDGALGSFGYRLYTGADGKLNFEVSGNGTATITVTGNTVLSTGKWYHVVGTYIPNTSLTVYLNGFQDNQNITSIPASINNPTAVVNFGAENAGGANLMFGAIDEVKIYNHALTADEVKVEYNRGSSIVLGALSDTSGLTGGSVASNSASAAYCIPGDTVTCSAPVVEWNFEEGNGGNANDTSGNGYTGTATGTTVTAGKIGKARNFTASDNISATIADSGNTNTLEVWIYPTTLIASKTIITNLTTNASSQPQYGSCTGTAIPLNQWTHIAAVSDGASICKIYQNGALSAVNTTGVTYGTSLNAGSSSFLGKLDEIKFFVYARTPAQVAWDYSRGAPMVWYKMDECQGTAIHDSSGNGSTGTLNLGSSGQTAAGTCTTNANTAWYNGRNGKYNSSLNFDGTDDYVTTAAFSPLAVSGQAATNLSWGGWYYPTTSAAGKTLMEKATEFQLITDSNSKPQCGIYYSSAFHNTTANTALTLNVWNHVICTYDGANVKVYVNGILDNTSSLETNSITAAISILYLGEASGGTNFYSGQIDEQKIWNYPLIAYRVRMEYNQGSAVRFGPLQGSP